MTISLSKTNPGKTDQPGDQASILTLCSCLPKGRPENADLVARRPKTETLGKISVTPLWVPGG